MMPRLRDVLFIPHGRVAGLIDRLEELVTDDSSARINSLVFTEYITTDNRPVRRIQIDYDSDSYYEQVQRFWRQIAEYSIAESQIAFLRPAGEASRLHAPAPSRRPGPPTKRQGSPVLPVPQMNWQDQHVYTPDLTKPGMPIVSMPDQFLWETLCWMTRNRDALFGEEVKNNRVPLPNNHSLAACLWLRDRPLYRVLLKESVRRALTFPPDVYRVFKDYVLDNKGTLAGYLPWRDPNFAHEAEALKPFLTHPTVPEQEDKERRPIEL